MWTYKHSQTTTKSTDQIWARYCDHATWVEWDHGLEHVEAHGPLAVGTTGSLTPRGQRPIPFTIVDVQDGRSFTDECAVGELTIRFRHEIQGVEGEGSRVTHEVLITGPGSDEAGARIGPVVTADLPSSVATLIELA